MMSSGFLSSLIDQKWQGKYSSKLPLVIYGLWFEKHPGFLFRHCIRERGLQGRWFNGLSGCVQQNSHNLQHQKQAYPTKLFSSFFDLPIKVVQTVQV